MMKKTTATTTLIICLALVCGCQQAFKEALISGAEIDQQLVNYARPENGAVIFASEDNPNHPISTLVDGITSAENWDAGEGWETHFDGPYAYGQYSGSGDDAWFADRLMRQMNQEALLRGERIDPRQRVDPRQFEDEDYKSRGLHALGYGGSIPSAMGWVVIELPEEKLITRVIIHTVDSEKYPARKYGVSDLGVQFWAPQAQSWQNMERLNKKVGDQHNSIRGNTDGRIVVRFQPVRTSKVRVVVRLTNDTETYRKTSYYHYMRGTVRLTEIEVYGLEKKDEVNAIAVGQKEEDERLLDELFAKVPVNEPDTVSAPDAEIPSTVPEAPAVDPIAQIEGVIRAYESAYKRRDLTGLMATISPNYSRDSEDYQQLKEKMEGLFQKYTQIDFLLQRLRIQPPATTAMVEADYSVVLTAVGPPTALSGKLYFTLSQSDNRWQITRIDTQRR